MSFRSLLPPLRERPEDIPVLVRYFAQKYARRMDRHIETIPTEAMEALARWPWPGNVRELENLIERSVILTPGTGAECAAGRVAGIDGAGGNSVDTGGGGTRSYSAYVAGDQLGDRRAEGRGGAVGDETDYAAVEDGEAGDR